MPPPHCTRLAPVIVTLAPLAGCAPKLTMDDLSAMRPQRPAELDRLDAFVGRWEWQGNAKIAGLDKTLWFTGQREAKWAGDGWYLVSHETGDMEGVGASKGLATWAYDAHRKKFRTTWADSMGTIALGTAWYDERTDTWQLRATSHTPSGTTHATGELRFVDADTFNWNWTEYAGLTKALELTGTCRRTD